MIADKSSNELWRMLGATVERFDKQKNDSDPALLHSESYRGQLIDIGKVDLNKVRGTAPLVMGISYEAGLRWKAERGFEIPKLLEYARSLVDEDLKHPIKRLSKSNDLQ